MMLSLLQTIADTYGLTFIYGEAEAFNQLADNVIDGQKVLYHEGYVAGPLSIDQQGAFDQSYDLRVYVLLASELADTPLERRPGFEELEPLLHRILDSISKHYILTPGRVQEGLNLTNRNLDGLRFIGTANPKVPLSYCNE